MAFCKIRQFQILFGQIDLPSQFKEKLQQSQEKTLLVRLWSVTVNYNIKKQNKVVSFPAVSLDDPPNNINITDMGGIVLPSNIRLPSSSYLILCQQCFNKKLHSPFLL